MLRIRLTKSTFDAPDSYSPQVTVAVGTSALPCEKAGKARPSVASGCIRESRSKLKGQLMRMMHRCFLAAAFVTAATLAAAHNELAREPRGTDTLVPTSAPPPAQSSAQKITIYTAKTIVTLDPGTPSAEAVAVRNGKILGAGTLDEVRGRPALFHFTNPLRPGRSPKWVISRHSGHVRRESALPQ